MIYTSPFPAIDIPDVSVYDLVFGDIGDNDLDRTAVIDGGSGRTVDFRELRGQVDAFAGALASRGIGRGDVVALHAPNSVEFVVALHGILRAGAVATTVNTLYTANEIAKQLSDARATRYVTISALLPNALAAVKIAGLPESAVLVLDEAEGHETLKALLAENRPAPSVSIDPGRDLAILPYSSGTTGNAKGVMLTHRNLVANILQCQPILGIKPEHSVLAVLPFFHIYGLTVMMNQALLQRAELVTMPRFDLPAFVQLVNGHRSNYLFIAPPLAVALLNDPRAAALEASRVRTVVSGAAPLDAELGRRLTARLECELLQGYGMTELSPVSHLTSRDIPGLSVGSIGVAVPNVEFKVVDPATGADVAQAEDGLSEPGELLVRSPGVMAGYLGNAEATAATIDADGFLRTGDIVRVSPSGEVWVVDRLKELIKYKGYQVPPAELEALLLTHPCVADAAVVAHPEPASGEVPHAFVVLRQDATATSEEIIAFVAERVAPHKKVRYLDFIATIPKSSAGKILRRELRANIDG